jgi:hypothetical protein
MRIRPDDDVYRVRAVWLGPRGLTLPWAARYLAYGVWLAVFLLMLAVEWLTPLTVGVPPVWEVALSVLATYWLMGFVDHDRPPGSLVALLRAEVSAPRAARRQRWAVSTRRVRVRASKEAT